MSVGTAVAASWTAGILELFPLTGRCSKEVHGKIKLPARLCGMLFNYHFPCDRIPEAEGLRNCREITTNPRLLISLMQLGANRSGTQSAPKEPSLIGGGEALGRITSPHKNCSLIAESAASGLDAEKVQQRATRENNLLNR
jgi:hypothetical protein